MDYFLCSNLKLVIALGLVIGVGSIILPLVFYSRRKNTGTTEEFRIVELRNGLYRVEQFRARTYGWDTKKEWGRPDDVRNSTFNTLAEAQAHKRRLEERRAENEGFNIKRVVE